MAWLASLYPCRFYFEGVRGWAVGARGCKVHVYVPVQLYAEAPPPPSRRFCRPLQRWKITQKQGERGKGGAREEDRVGGRERLEGRDRGREREDGERRPHGRGSARGLAVWRGREKERGQRRAVFSLDPEPESSSAEFASLTDSCTGALIYRPGHLTNYPHSLLYTWPHARTHTPRAQATRVDMLACTKKSRHHTDANLSCRGGSHSLRSRTHPRAHVHTEFSLSSLFFRPRCPPPFSSVRSLRPVSLSPLPSVSELTLAPCPSSSAPRAPRSPIPQPPFPVFVPPPPSATIGGALSHSASILKKGGC